MKRSLTIALGLSLALLCSSRTWAAPIVVPGQDISVAGSATFNGSAWEYRYTIANTLGSAITPVRFIVSEHNTHAGLHHEFNFLNDGGTFQYDFPVPPQFPGISAHNYFWNDLDILGNNSIVVGFNDIHGPGLASWGIQARGQYVDTTNKLPVPAVPEPASLLLFVVGLAVLLGFYGTSLKGRN